MNQATFDAIVGKKKGTNPLIKDSDGDGKINMLDCKPNDPNKQGWIHNVGAAIAEKVGAHDISARIKQRGAEVDDQKQEIREAVRETRFRESKDTAIYTEKVKAESQRKAIKERFNRTGGGSGFAAFNRPFITIKLRPRTSGSKGKKVVTYVKKGGHYVKKTYYAPTKVKVASAPRQNLQDRNRDGIPDILGVNQRKGKAKPFRMF